MTQTARAHGRANGRANALAHGLTLAALLGWWGYSLLVPAYLLPGPVIVGQRMLEFLLEPELAAQLLVSLAHVLGSLGLAFVIGAALAVLAHGVPALRLLVEGRITPFLNAFSGIGWLFLGILWFGINHTTVVFAVTLILTPFAVINLMTGLDELDAELDELGLSLTRDRGRVFARIVLPQLVPYVFATLRTGFGVAWKVVLTSELFGGNAGIGYELNMARQELDTETIFAVILFILLFVILVEALVFRPLQRRLDSRYRLG